MVSDYWGMETIGQARGRIEEEFDEPLVDVIRGYAAEGMKYSCPAVADVLEVTPESLKSFCRRQDIRFPVRPMERRGASPGRPPRLHRENGQEKSLTAWAMDLGVAPCTVHKRLRRRGRVR